MFVWRYSGWKKIGCIKQFICLAAHMNCGRPGILSLDIC
jgi:hypothetical protein